MGRLVRVSLQQVPLEVRRKAATPLIKHARDDGGWANLMVAVELEAAVLVPSDRGYLVPADAVARVLGV